MSIRNADYYNLKCSEIVQKLHNQTKHLKLLLYRIYYGKKEKSVKLCKRKIHLKNKDNTNKTISSRQSFKMFMLENNIFLKFQ